MKKDKAVLVLMIFLSLFVFLNFASKPDHMLYLINKRKEAVYINCEISREMKAGERDYVLRYLNEYIGNLFLGYYWGYYFTYKIDPGDGIMCYEMDWNHNLASKEFLKLEPLEQFKIIYSRFTVRDEKGIEILNLNALKPEDFIFVPPVSNWYIDVSNIRLIIK